VRLTTRGLWKFNHRCIAAAGLFDSHFSAVDFLSNNKVLFLLAFALFPGLDNTPGVCGFIVGSTIMTEQ
jgi:hypothetical protein